MITPTLFSSTPDTLHQLVQAAVLAPSSHNTQPWLFETRVGSLHLRADRTRALPVNDPDDRELTMSCGCALFNLRVAAAHIGAPLHISVLPDKDDEDLLAIIDIEESGAASTELLALWPAVDQRRTYRKAFAERAVMQVSVAALTQAAASEHAWLHAIESDITRSDIARLVAQGDATQWANPSWRRELAQWMHPRRRGDGLSMPGLAVPIAQAVVRTFDMGQGVGAKDQELADASPLLAVLGTTGDSPAHWLQAGQALQSVLLTACTRGLQASYLNQAVQVPLLRTRLQHVLARPGFPQLILRVGYPQDALPASPRRALADVMDCDLAPRA